MHFVSDLAGKKLIRAHKDIFSPTSGEKIGIQGSIWLNLERGTAPDWAVAEAMKLFKFASRPSPGSIGGVDIPVEQWCVYVDTEQWGAQHNHSPEIIERANLILGSSSDMAAVEPPVLRPPWPSYAKMTVQGSRTADKVAERNLATALEIGVFAQELIDYEEATLNRVDVIAAYEAAIEADRQDDPTTVTITA